MLVAAAGGGECPRTGEVAGETGVAGVGTGEDMVGEEGTGVAGEAGNCRIILPQVEWCGDDCVPKLSDSVWCYPQ